MQFRSLGSVFEKNRKTFGRKNISHVRMGIICVRKYLSIECKAFRIVGKKNYDKLDSNPHIKVDFSELSTITIFRHFYRKYTIFRLKDGLKYFPHIQHKDSGSP